MIRPRITGDSYRDYKKYLEIQKMNNPSSYSLNSTINNTNNINSNNVLSNTLQRQTNTPSIYSQFGQTNRLSRPQSTSNIITNKTININDLNNLNFQNNEENSSLNNIDNISLPSIKSRTINSPDINSLYSISNNNKEIDNLKLLLSKSLQNQNEMKNQIIEYNKIISSQENIIRLNNLKLNEHDNKLTEVLLSFNNFLQFNEKSAAIVSEMQKKMENFVKIEDFSNLKNNFLTTNQNNENKFNEINSNIEDIKLNIIENKKENDTYQKYSLDRLTKIQNDFLSNKLEQQNELIKFEDTRNENFKKQINQIKSQIKINENYIEEEINNRKNMINELRDEFLTIFNKKDEQISNLEKNQLINEDNMMKLNKEFVQSLNDLINKSNQKHDIEMKTIRSLIEASVQKNQKNLETMINDEKEKISIIENNLNEYTVNFNNLDKYTRKSILGIEEKYEIFKDENNNYKTKLELISDTLHKYMNENINVINQKIINAENNLSSLLNEENKKNLEKIKNISDFSDKNIKDINEKINDLSHQVLNLAENKNKNVNDNLILNDANNPNVIVIKEMVYNTCDELLRPVKMNFNDFNQELKNELNEKIENSKKLYSLEQINSMKKIEDMIQKKINLVKNDLENDINITKNMLDGTISTYMVESELHIKEKYDKEISEIKKEIEQLNTKIIVGT